MNTTTATQLVQRLISRLDQMISQQLSKIVHAPVLQQLEASWRSLHHLIQQVRQDHVVIIKALSLSKAELKRDVLQVIEFDQSQLFHKVYSQEFGSPGGVPFNILIGDYEFGSNREDTDILSAMAQIAASAFTPFIAGTAPSLFGLHQFQALSQQPDLTRIFQQREYDHWQQLRQSEDAKFLGLTLPRRLVREPYSYPGKPMPFCFQDPNPDGFLWGNACYGFACVLIKSFMHTGWLGSIRGFHPDKQSDGQVPPIAQSFYKTDKPNVLNKPQTDVILTDKQERTLHQLGFLTLRQSYRGNACVFYQTASLQQATIYNKEIATTNAKTASHLHYLLCACRFAHYLKVLGRDKIGSGYSALACQNWLNNWLLKFTASNSMLPEKQRSRYPLQTGRVKVAELPGKPGFYRCIMYLKPHFQFEQLQSHIVLVTELHQ